MLMATLATAAAPSLAADKAPEQVLATVNSDFVAENQLTLARQAAAEGDYAAAAHMVLALAERQGGYVVPVGEQFYRPIWRQVLDDLSQWPEAGLAAYRQLVDEEAAGLYARAAAAGDLAALERLVETRLLSGSGDQAAAALADRLAEAGDFALASYYYGLVLDKCPDTRLKRDRLLTKALLSAHLAGLDGQAVLISEQLKGRPLSLFGQNTAEAIRRMAAQPQTADALHRTGLPTCEPAAVAWMRTLTTQPIRSRYPLASTTLPCAAYRDGQLIVTFQTSLWRLDARTGDILWRYDADGRSDDADPVHYFYEQAHRPLFGDEAVITPLSCGGREVVGGQVGGVVSLRAFRPSDGSPLWQWSPWGKQLGSSPLAVDTAPVADPRRVYVPLATMADLFGEVQVAAVDRLSGRLVWQRGIGSHNNQLPLGRWSLPGMPLSTGLTLRGGLLVSCGGGLLTVQSTVSGTILWQRQVPQRTDFDIVRCPLKDMPGMVFNGQLNSRRPPALVRGRWVAAGDASTSEVILCDLLSGRLIWSQPADDAAQLLAMDDDRLYTWGRTLIARDAKTGQAVWRLSLDEKELVAAMPLLTPTDAYVATDRRLLIVNLSDGTVRQEIAWPADHVPGEMLLTSEGLLVLEPRQAVMYECWPATKTRFETAATADPADARPLMDLGRTAMRLGRRREGLDVLARAQDRVRADQQASVTLFELYAELLTGLSDADREKLGAEIIDRMGQCAATPEAVARQALIEGEFYASTNPQRAAIALHRALASDDIRRTELREDLAGVLAERRLRKLAAIAGKELLAPFERQAAEARARAAAQTSDTAGALHEAALQFAATREAVKTLEAELNEHQKSHDFARAASLLERLVMVTPDGATRWRYRLTLALVLYQNMGQTERARLQVEAVLHEAAASEDKLSPEALKAAQSAATTLDRPGDPAARRVPLGSGPYEPRWQFDLPPKPNFSQTPVADRRSDKARAAQPLIVSNRYGLWALDRKDGAMVWHEEIDLGKRARGVVPILLLDSAVVVGTGDRVRALDPANGRELWQTVFEVRPQVLEPSMLVAMERGSELHFMVRTFQVMRLDLQGGMVLVETAHTQHLLAPEDGYVTATAEIEKNGREIAFLDDALPAAIGTRDKIVGQVDAWDLATGKALKGFQTKQDVALCGPGGQWFEALVALPENTIALADLREGQLRWESKGNAPAAGRRPACRLGENLLLVGTWDGRAVALRVADGNIAWQQTLGATPSEAAWEIVPLDGDALVRCGRLAARIRADGKVLWRHRLAADEFMAELRPLRQRALIVGSRRNQDGETAFVQTIDLATGKADRRTELSADEVPGRINVVPDADGLLVVGPEIVRYYATGKP